MATTYLILVINPGSTSTKLSLFQDEKEVADTTLRHTAEELAPYEPIAAQASFRSEAIQAFMGSRSIDEKQLSAVVGRGGLLHPLKGGVYEVNDAMVRDLSSGRYGQHASNLGGVLARSIADRASCPGFVADPVVVDEMDDVARFSGLPSLPRRSIFHALNQKSAAREACLRRGLVYEESNLIVAHLGGGVTVGAHLKGRVVDVNNGLDGEGPFSPERAGTLPAGQLVELAFSGNYTLSEMKKMLTGGGGLVAHCGTNDEREVRERASGGDSHADLVLRAMCYRIAKEIASHGATLSGSVDLVVLTGGFAKDKVAVDQIRKRVGFLGPVEVVPGEREMISLARAGLAALRGECEVLIYA